MLIDTSAESVVERIEQEYRRRTRRSAELFQAANVYIPGGASRSLVVFHPYPLCMTAGQGAHFTDVDGHDYIDFVNCHSALVHGHAHPAITAAIQQQAAHIYLTPMASLTPAHRFQQVHKKPFQPLPTTHRLSIGHAQNISTLLRFVNT